VVWSRPGVSVRSKARRAPRRAMVSCLLAVTVCTSLSSAEVSLQQRMRQLETDIDTAQRGFEPVVSAGLGGERCKNTVAYDRDEVTKSLGKLTQELVDQLSRPEEAGVRAWAVEELPNTVATSQQLDLCFRPVGINAVSQDSSQAAFAEVKKVAQTIGSLDTLSVSFRRSACRTARDSS